MTISTEDPLSFCSRFDSKVHAGQYILTLGNASQRCRSFGRCQRLNRCFPLGRFVASTAATGRLVIIHIVIHPPPPGKKTATVGFQKVSQPHWNQTFTLKPSTLPDQYQVVAHCDEDRQNQQEQGEGGKIAQVPSNHPNLKVMA